MENYEEEKNEEIVKPPKVMVLTSRISNEISNPNFNLDNYKRMSGSFNNIKSFKLGYSVFHCFFQNLLALKV